MTYRIIVKGRVQGVFYRQSAKEKAAELEIAGHVCNADNGDVHIIATGTKLQLEDFITWCKIGPPRAVVHRVITEQIPLQEFDRFTIQRF